MTTPRLILVTLGVANLICLHTARGQSIDTPQTRMRPLGSPSLVDQFRRDDRAGVRQAAWMQDITAPPLPGSGMSLPGTFTPPAIDAGPASALPMPPTAAPRSLPANPVPVPQNPTSNSDYAPLLQPRLGDSFATLGNSCHVSGPSTYTAASAAGCCAPVTYAPVNYQTPPVYEAPPATIPGPAVVPGGVAPGTTVIPTAPTSAPAGALISFGQDRYPVQVGQGLFGQPVAYVPGQPCRNWIRYFFP